MGILTYNVTQHLSEYGLFAIFLPVLINVPLTPIGITILYSGLSNRRKFNKIVLYQNMKMYYSNVTISKQIQDYIKIRL